MSTPMPRRGIPDATVARLPDYLRVLGTMSARGIPSTSSEELATAAGVRSAKVRKDLSYLGTYGVRGVGYDVEHLAFQIATELGLAKDWPVVIVGLGNLGRALASYAGLAARGFCVVGLYDRDPDLAGQRIGRVAIAGVADLAALRDTEDMIGVIATPASSAQEAADALTAVGITSILNFAASAITVPSGVDVRKVDVTTELQILAFHKQRRAAAREWAETAT